MRRFEETMRLQIRPGEFEPYKVELAIELRKVMGKLGKKAARNKSGKTKLMGGLITVTAREVTR